MIDGERQTRIRVGRLILSNAAYVAKAGNDIQGWRFSIKTQQIE